MIVHFSAHISKWELVCKFGVIFHTFIISCLCSRFHVWNNFFLLSNNLFIYQVLCTLIYRRRSLYSFLPLYLSMLNSLRRTCLRLKVQLLYICIQSITFEQLLEVNTMLTWNHYLLICPWCRIYASVNQVTIGSIMACRLFGTKPLSKSMLVYCQLDP